jgi:hypothetical protein
VIEPAHVLCRFATLKISSAKGCYASDKLTTGTIESFKLTIGRLC